MTSRVLLISSRGVFYFEDGVCLVLPVDPEARPYEYTARNGTEIPFNEFGFDRITNLNLVYVIGYRMKYLPYDFSKFENLMIILSRACLIDLTRNLPEKIFWLQIGSQCEIVGNHPPKAKFLVEHLDISRYVIIHNRAVFKETFELVGCCSISGSTNPMVAEAVVPTNTLIIATTPLFALTDFDDAFRINGRGGISKEINRTEKSITQRRGFRFEDGFLLAQKFPFAISIEMNLNENNFRFPGENYHKLLSRLIEANPRIQSVTSTVFILHHNHQTDHDFAQMLYDYLAPHPGRILPDDETSFDPIRLRWKFFGVIWNKRIEEIKTSTQRKNE